MSATAEEKATIERIRADHGILGLDDDATVAKALEELYGLVETDSKRSFTLMPHPEEGTMGRAHGARPMACGTMGLGHHPGA